MDWITDDILIGNYIDAQDLDALREAGVRSIIGLNGERYDVDYGGVGIWKAKVFDLIDGAGNDPYVFFCSGNIKHINHSIYIGLMY